MKKFIILLFIIPLLFVARAQSQPQDLELDAPTQALLHTLDDIIQNHKVQYQAQRIKQINELKAQARTATGYNKYNLYKEIFDLYSHFQTDSAQVYICKMQQLPAYKTDVVMQATLHVAQAEIMAVSALYAEALSELDKVPQSLISPEHAELRLYYYRVKRTLYGWMCIYYKKPSEQHKLWEEKTMSYRDSLLLVDTQKNMNRDIVMADKYNALHQPEKTLKLLEPYSAQASEAAPNPFVCFTLAHAYVLLGNRSKAIHYLTLTAIADLRSATCEYQALPMLAQILFDQGDVERAYTYLLCSMEDASYCKAGLRSIEASTIFPIIDKQYKQREKAQRERDHLLMYGLVSLSFILIAMVVYLRKQMLKLRQMRQKQSLYNKQLSAANQQMHEANEKLQVALQEVKSTNEELQNTYSQLRMTDKVKEEYIARYLNRCRMYLDQLTEFRSATLRLVKNRHFEELANQLKRDLNAKTEQTQFYEDFDAAFLTLFPDFVASFNALLQPEHQLSVKKNGLLNTELRIYALIRLGIHDTTRIAHFLDYSTATVYNYRSKIRKKAICSPEEFESLVAVIS